MAATLLIVDDDADIRMMTRLTVGGTPIEVIGEATDGREALEMVERLKPDVVLMDVLMPVMDGIAATRLIRQRFPDVIVLGFTASGVESGQDMIQAGAVAVFEKSHFADLIHHLQQWMTAE